MPRYELVGESSSTVWEIRLEGTAVTTRQGTNEPKTRRFSAPGEAKREYDNAVAAKLKAGYLLVPGSDVASPPTKRKVVFVRLLGPQHGTSRQWFEVTLDGRTVKQRNGWNEKANDDSREKHATEADAKDAFDHLLTTYQRRNLTVAERTEKELPAEPEPAPLTWVENPELEAAVLAAPDDAQAASVYADFLQTHGDLRGELAALHLRGKAMATALLEKHRDALFGDAEPQLDRELYDLVWRHGFLSGASLKRKSIDSQTELARLTANFLAAPVSRLVTFLTFGLASYESDNSWTDTMEAVAASRQAGQLRALRFNDYTYEDCEISWTPFGDFSKAWRRLPALEVLHVRSGAGGTLGELELPKLKTFIRESGGLSAEELGCIANATWPQLERLDVWTGSSGYNAEGTVGSLLPILDARGLPKLRHLGVVNCEFLHELLPVLAGSKLLPQLTSLDLSKGALISADVELILSVASHFAHLTTVDLSENLLSDEATERIKRALPNAKTDAQREVYDEGDEGDRRYVAVGE